MIYIDENAQVRTNLLQSSYFKILIIIIIILIINNLKIKIRFHNYIYLYIYIRINYCIHCVVIINNKKYVLAS